ncbi:MAG: hypothetical protein JF606_28170, partial [Burkholderiales bacterium]|nr:hypothetical protein [Burkholderiales bacterium]
MSPRRDGESNQADAGRLRPQLTLPEISLPSGVTDSNPRRGPAFRALPEHLAAIREQFPRLDGVSNQTYARRLLLAHPELTFLEISLLSGVTESNLRRAPAFRALPEHLAAIREQFPRVDGESNGTYARHLLLWRPELTFLEISLLSGVTDSNLRRGPASLPPALIRLRRDLRAPDTPRTAQARSFMDASAPAQGPDSVFDRYRRRLDENDRRADGPDIANEAGPIRRQRLSQDTRSAGEDLAIDLERQQRALSLEIGQWLREGGNEVPGGIADFDQEANARSFARVLNRLLPRARGRDGEELRRQGNAVIKAIA